MYCPQCGGANDDTAPACSACGLDLDAYRRRRQTLETRAVEEMPAPTYAAPPYRQQHESGYGPPPYDPPGYGQSPYGQSPYGPAPYWQAPYGPVPPHIPSYLGWAIAVLILCFWPTGIAAVVYASQVDGKLVRGDIEGARESSRKAKTWCWITFGIAVGLFVVAILVVLFAAAVFTGAGSTIY